MSVESSGMDSSSSSPAFKAPASNAPTVATVGRSPNAEKKSVKGMTSTWNAKSPTTASMNINRTRKSAILNDKTFGNVNGIASTGSMKTNIATNISKGFGLL
jgi:hypothetical protein